MKRFLLLFFFIAASFSAVLAQTSLSGKITDKESGEPILFGTVVLYKNGNLYQGTETDLDGNYSFSNIDPGNYDIEASYTGYQPQRTEGVQVLAGKAIKLDLQLGSGITLDLDVEVKAYRNPLVEQDNTTSGAVITSDQIRNLPVRNINAVAATSAGLSAADEGDAITIRGSRSNATDYYVDGIRVRGSLVPETEIEQLQVITGGMEAQYGDVTGGVISITTKGPSSKFSGSVEAETSTVFDDYNVNLLGFNLSGPILKNSKGVSVLGFRVSGRYNDRDDDDPPAVPVYRVTDEKLAELEANPLVSVGGTRLVAADYMTANDAKPVKAKPYEESSDYNLTAKLDARLSDAIDITFTGIYSNGENRFTPGGWRLLNSQNNPLALNSSYRGNFRFRHRLGGAPAGENRSASVIQNASYTLQAGYEKTDGESYDYRHRKNIFEYGYLGKFDVDYVPVFGEALDTLGNSYGVHVGYRPVLRSYEPAANNSVLANYNNVLGFLNEEGLNTIEPNYGFSDNRELNGQSLVSLDDFVAINGRTLGIFGSSWNFHTNVGQVYNSYGYSDGETYTFNANAAFDFVPGGSEKGRHNIQLGIIYEQRINRNYTVAPVDIWTLARQQANIHLQGINLEAPDTVGVFDLPGFGQTPLLKVTQSADSDLLFYKKIRESLGMGLDQYVNIDGLDPSQLSLDMFAAKELNDRGVLGYYGYDYLGNRFDGNFEDFFTTVDPVTGLRTFPVAPNRPIYSAAFIQDKFTFKDIIFRIGLRVDRYDANTKIPKDVYSLYEIMGAGEFHSLNGGEKPGNIGDDYKVYLVADNGTAVRAYRDEDAWYKGDGTPVNGAQNIEGIRSGLIYPYYKDERVRDAPNFIKDPAFDPNVSFEDYETQVNFMPRLAFSFPISKDANFFAHYDILVQRPPSNTLSTPLTYYYFFESGTSVRNNPRLRPERTIDYEVGFNQVLSQSSAIKISAYYKEMRDMIQSRVIFPVPVVGSYTTYGNIDFGTVKGFSFQYDLRRTGNVSLQANYTMQFADGTGSDANSQRGLNNNGVLRTLFPLNFDERHRFNLVMDYRYGSGKTYAGPRLFGLDVFANAGINLQGVAVSGRAYTVNQTPLELGGTGLKGAINGARKPWNFTLNLRIDKDFDLGNRLGLNVFLRVSNVLDRRNIIGVYSATGSADDDGFLRSSRGQDQIENIAGSNRSLESYLVSYQWALINPDFYSLPRRMFVGAYLSF
ncbi:MAG TPA: TonB-dependent receptor [Flavilitoribacter sp.]|nr:TonB-dependent receptor [Flavilitoribacter sp.]